MASTQFVDYSQNTPIVAAWLNDVNGNVYGPTSSCPPGTLRYDLNNSNGGAGTGANMVGFDGVQLDAQLKSRIERTVDSMAQLLALNPATYTRVKMLGWAAPGDGGLGSFYYSGTAPYAANGATVVNAFGGGYWILEDTGVLRPEQFGALGVGDDTAAFATLAGALRQLGGASIVFITKNHTVFTSPLASGTTTLIDLTGCSNVTFVYRGAGNINPTYPNGTTNIATAWIYGLNNTQGFLALGASLTASSNIPTVSGVVHFGVNTGLSVGAQSSNLRMHSVKQVGGLGGLIVYPCGNAFNVRAEQIELTGTFNGTFYPANFQGNGDSFRGNIVTRGCGRSYFTYNNSQHEVMVNSDNGTAFDDIDITLYTNPNMIMETSHIKVFYKCYGSNAKGNMLAMNLVQYDATSRTGSYHDIEVNFDVNLSSFTGAFFSMNKYLSGSPGSPGGADNSPRGYNVWNVKLTGSCRSDTAQNLGQLWTQADWTGEFIFNFSLADLFLSAAAGSYLAIDGRGLTTANGMLFDGVVCANPLSLTNEVSGTVQYNRSTVSTGRLDGITGTGWDIFYPAPGVAQLIYQGAYSFPVGTTTITLPLSDKTGNNPRTFVQPLGSTAGFNVDPATANSFTVTNSGAGAVLANMLVWLRA